MAVDRFNQQSRSKVTVSLITGGLHGLVFDRARLVNTPGDDARSGREEQQEEEERRKENERRGREEKGKGRNERESSTGIILIS